MLYFNQFPTIQTTDYQGNSVVVTNILERTELIPSLLNNELLFYAYDIQDGDTPDIIANKYYSDPSRFWIVMYGNQLFDSVGDWPMNSNLFADYLLDKYADDAANSLNVSANTITVGDAMAYTQNTTYQYIKTVTTTDGATNNSNTNTYIIDSNAYANVTTGTVTKTFPYGVSVTVTTFAYPQSIYEYEVQLNESKRNINLINVSYAGAMESQLQNLLSS
jgi:hypothetical protein